MAKKKKTKQEALSPDLRQALETAAEEIGARLSEAEAGKTFTRAAESLAGHADFLIRALAKKASAEMLGFLYRLLSDLEDKHLVKEVKRAIYRLEQSGIQTPEEIRPRSRPVFQAPKGRTPFGYLTNYDSSLITMGILAIPEEPTGYAVAVFMNSLDKGLVDFDLYALTTRDIEKMVQNFSETSEHGVLVPVPAKGLRFLLAEGVRKSKELGRPVPETYDDFITLIGGITASDRPPIFELAPPDRIEAAAYARDSLAHLVGHSFLDPMFGDPDLTGLWEKFDEIDRGVLIVSETQKNEQKKRAIQAHARAILESPKRFRLQRFLEDTAATLWQVEEKDLALVSLGLARDLAGDQAEERAGMFFDVLVEEAITRLRSRDGDIPDDLAEENPEDQDAHSILVVP